MNNIPSTEYYEDIRVHDKYKSREYLLTEKEIVEFANVWMPRPHHVDPEFARNSTFGSLIATGNHLISILYRLTYEVSCEKTTPTAYIAALGLKDIQFAAPARPGDLLVFHTEVTSKRASRSDPKAGIVTYACRLINQHGDTVLTMNSATLVDKRPER
ncbi:MAG: MaoC/PaaZ C-terminal domain-containing protein [Dehalococcoidia bacterium]|nr:MaoC/PaaZ C-terminal domain-containing protein [Dehalococcoidia bacterium]